MRDLERELLDYVREKEFTTQSEIRKNKRNFRNTQPKILDSLVKNLEEDGFIDTHKTDKGRVFLIWKGANNK